MTEFLDALNMDKWRALIAEFDAKRIQFANEFSEIARQPAVNADLERVRQNLLKAAAPIKLSIDTLYNSLKNVRSWLQQAGSFFGFGASETMNGLGLAPIVIGVGLAAAAAIIASITGWLTKAAEYKASNERIRQLIAAGATPAEILKSQPKEQLEIFGVKAGGLKWVAIIAGIVIAGPYLVKGLKRYRIFQ